MATGIQRRKSISRVFSGAFAAAFAFAAGASAAPGPDEARLEAELSAELEALRVQYGFPGAAASVALPGGDIVTVAAGYADVERQIPMRADHRMLSGSIGKTFVSALAVKLAIAGALDLDEKISVWFGGEDWFSRLPNGPDITLRMLLNHSSGLENHAWYLSVNEAVGKTFVDGVDYRPSHEELVAMILDKPPLFPAGEGFSYSDTNFILAAWILEIVAGREFYALLQDEILDPLGLDDTTPQVGRDYPGLAAGYMDEGNEFKELGFPDKVAEIGRLYFDPTFEWTGGGLVTTSRDLARWGEALYFGRAFEGPYVDLILNGAGGRAPITDIPELGPYQYGLAVYIHDSPLGTMVGHGGVMFGYTSRLRCVIEKGFCIAVQINRTFDQHTQDYVVALGEIVATHLEKDSAP